MQMRSPSPSSEFRLVWEDLHSLEQILDEQPKDLVEWSKWLNRLDEQGAALLGQVRGLPPVLRWVQCFAEQVRDQRAELTEVALTDEGGKLRDESNSSFNLPLSSFRLPPSSALVQRCEQLAARAAKLATDMDFTLLYNKQRHLFVIGYNLTLGRLDNAHYDLLASERV